MMLSYQYTPLDSTSVTIRILTLHAGLPDDCLTTTLSHTSIATQNHSRHSPTNGATKPTLAPTPTINDLPGPRPLRRNLEHAFRTIRTENTAHQLWVDAICIINQDDLAERGHQVTAMGDIFRQAEKVIARIGPEADGSDIAMDLIARGGKGRLDIPQLIGRDLNSVEIDAIAALTSRTY